MDSYLQNVVNNFAVCIFAVYLQFHYVKLTVLGCILYEYLISLMKFICFAYHL